MITICTWLWGTKYGTSDVFKLKRGLDRNMDQPFRFILVTEPERPISPSTLNGVERRPIIDPLLLLLKGCFVRLRMFDSKWQKDLNITDRLVCMDLDSVVTRRLDHLFDRSDPFVILAGANSTNPCPFNGSIMMLKPGAHEDVWTDWSYAKAEAAGYYQFPDDQGWLAHKIPNAATWRVGPVSGIYAFKKPGWPSGLNLPLDARLVVFPGQRSPSQFTHLSWVDQHWSH